MSKTPLTDSKLVRVYGKTGEMCAATTSCGHPTYVPSEFARQQELEIDRLVKEWSKLASSSESASREGQSIRSYRVLKSAVDAMMAPLGYHGTISARDDRVQAVMDALAQVDEVDK